MYDETNYILDMLDRISILEISDCDSSCPCGHAYIRGVNFDFHCWRSSGVRCDVCEFSGLHVSKKEGFEEDFNIDLQKVGEKALAQLRVTWNNTDWKLVIE